MRQGEIIKKFRSKRGNSIILRVLKRSDIKLLLDMINSVIDERDFILATKRITLKKEKMWIEDTLKKMRAGKKIVIVAETDGRIIGNSGIDKGSGVREHVGTFGITLVDGYRSEGIGQVLMKEMLKLGKKVLNLKLVLLDVYNTNRRAQGLYKKLGFKRAGIIPKAINRRGKLIPEIMMYKEL